MKKSDEYFHGKMFLVTGAGSGIGLAVTGAILERGGSVCALVRSSDALKSMAGRFGDRLRVFRGDVTDEESCTEFVKSVSGPGRRLDGLIHCAGIGLRSRASHIDMVTFRKIFETNFYSAVFLCNAARRGLENSNGTFLVVSSVQGKIPLPYRSVYGASKHALNAYIKSLMLEERQIHFSIVNFGYVNTKFSLNALKGDGSRYAKESDGQKKGMSPDRAARVILDAVVRRKKEVTAAGWRERLGLFLYRNLPGVYNYAAGRYMGSDE